MLRGLDSRPFQNLTARHRLTDTQQDPRQDQRGGRPFRVLGRLPADQGERLVVPALADLLNGRIELLLPGFGGLPCRLTLSDRPCPQSRLPRHPG